MPPISSKQRIFTKIKRMIEFDMRTSERTEGCSAAGVSSFAGSLPASESPCRPLPIRSGGQAQIISRASSERTKSLPKIEGDSSFARSLGHGSESTDNPQPLSTTTPARDTRRLKALVPPALGRAGLGLPGRTGCGNARRPARSSPPRFPPCGRPGARPRPP